MALLALFMPLEASSQLSPLPERYVSVDVGYNKNFWSPRAIENARYNTTGVDSGVIQLHSPFFSKFVNKPLLRYEWTFGNRRQQDLIQGQMQADTRLEKTYDRFLTYIPLKTLRLKYEKEVFIADVELRDGRTYYPPTGGSQFFPAGSTISEMVVFEEVALHFTRPMAYYGISYGRFQKPYEFTGSEDADAAIYDAEFSYVSFDLGFNSRWPEKPGFSFIYDFCMGIGYGSIELTESLAVRGPDPQKDYTLASWAFSGLLGTQYNNSWLSVTLTGAARLRTFHLTEEDDTQEGYEPSDNSINLNKDLITKIELTTAIKF